MQVDPQQLGPALVSAPKVFGYSVQAVERRLMGLTWIQPDKKRLVQVGSGVQAVEATKAGAAAS